MTWAVLKCQYLSPSPDDYDSIDMATPPAPAQGNSFPLALSTYLKYNII